MNREMAQNEVILENEDFYENYESKRTRTDQRSHSFLRRYDKQRSKRRLTSNEHNNSLESSENLEAFVIDNGAYSIKFGSTTCDTAKVVPNCIMKAKSERKRLFIGDQIEECRDCSGLYFLLPCERGYITKWDVQKPIWDYAFGKNKSPINDNTVIMTQPLFNFKTIQDCIDEIFFEEYEVSSMVRANPTDLARLKYAEEIGVDNPCVVVDSGFSFTHVIPYIEGKKYFKGIKRINVGGKLLTNHLKDIISYRQYHVMEETYVINQVKEDTCYVAENFKADLKAAAAKRNNPIVRNYVLPDFNTIRRGYIQEQKEGGSSIENCQILRLNNERFSVPELLFHPSDIGIKSMGVAEAVAKSITLCPPQFRSRLAKNIILIGGNANFPGFKNRLYSEVRSILPDIWEINVYQPENPVTFAWSGGKSLLKNPAFKNTVVTKAEYEEQGSSISYRKFNEWTSFAEDKSEKQTEIKPVSLLDHIKKFNIFGKANFTNEETQNEEPKNGASASKSSEVASSKSSQEDGRSLSSDVMIENDTSESNSTSDSFRSAEILNKNERGPRGRNIKRKATEDVEIVEEQVVEVEEEEDYLRDSLFPFGTSYL